MPVKKKESSTSNSLRPSPAKLVQNDKVRSPRKTGGLSVSVFSLAGRSTGTMSLPKEIFGKEVNKKLLAQAVRVYMTNQKNLTASTKTRGQVRGSTAKIMRQKGTGRARHGSIRAPIFVGGGIVFGPKPRHVRLELPKKMRKAALIAALSVKAVDKEIIGLSGLEKATGKTKDMVKLLKKVNSQDALIVTAEKKEMIVRGVRNIPGVDVLPVNQVNAYEVLRHKMLILTKDSIEKFTR